MAAVNTYQATATREGRWWVVEVDGVGATQARNTRQAEEMAVDMVAAVIDVQPIEITVNITYEIPGHIGDEVKSARRAVAAAAEAQERAASESRRVVKEILELGMSQRDAARVLGVSPQRVNQLVRH